MPDRSSNDIWSAPQSPDPFEMRAHRFRDDMRPLLFAWFGIAPDMRVLDAGCGSGVFTRYIARGLTTGHITGFDINEGFVAYGRRRAAELELDARMALDVADGFALPYADGAFDAVVNYTYLGVLSDPPAGLRELIRVCRPGGTVSYAEGTTQYIGWQGDYPFEGAADLQRLTSLENDIHAKHIWDASRWRQSTQWPPTRAPKLFDACGLTDVHVYPYAHAICFQDDALPLDYRRALARRDADEQVEWLRSRYAGNEERYAQYGFARADYERLLALLERKRDYIEAHFEDDRSFAWNGGLNFIVTGRKAG